jgi:hypothetical protein
MEVAYVASVSGKDPPLFARIVDFVSSPGKTRIVNETIQNKLMPTLRVQPGFVDEIVLESDSE